MNRIASTLAGLSLAVLFFVASAHAESERVTANVPFEFTFGSISLPAGQYQFLRTGGDGYIVVARNAEGRTWFTLASALIQEHGLSAKSVLEFASVDGHHALVRIWNGPAANGIALTHKNTSMELAGIEGSVTGR